MKLTRKEFLAGLAGAAIAGSLIPGCGPDENGNGNGNGDGGTDGGTDAGTNGSQNCPAPTIEGNHGHVLQVSRADVEAGVEKTYDIRGSATHEHSVTLTAAHFVTLQGGDSVTVQSTDGSFHTHEVTVSCPA